MLHHASVSNEESRATNSSLTGNSLRPQYDSTSSSTCIPTTNEAIDEAIEKHVFTDQTNYVPVRTIITIFLACASVDMLALIDQTTLAVSLQTIGSDLHAGAQISWIANGYFLSSTSFQLLYGRLSDIWSRKLVLLVGILIFFVGSLAASLARNVQELIAFRVLTGVGGGGLMTVAQIIVSDVVPLRERGKYQGILGAVVALSNGVGPVIGGALVAQSHDSWRWIFRLNLPLSCITALAVIFFMPLRKVEGDWKRKLKAIDIFGAFLTLAGTTLFVLGLTWAGSQYAWNSAHVIVPLVLGIVTLAAFVLWEGVGHPLPLIPLHIFRRKVVNGACLTMFINGWNFVVQVYYIPTFYQLEHNYTPLHAGLLLLPLTLTQTLSSTISGLVITRTGVYKPVLLIGWAVWAIGLGLFSTLTRTSGLGPQIGYALLTGVGVGMTLQPSLVAIQAGVERKDMAVVTGLRNFIRNLGATIGLAVAGTILNNSVDPHAPVDSEAYRRGFRVIFLVGAGLAVVAFFGAWGLMPDVGLDRKDDEDLKREGRRKKESNV